MDAGEILGVLGHDLEDVIGGARHQMTFQNIRHPRHGFFERFKQLIRLTAEFDFNKDSCRDSQLSGIEQCDVVPDIPIRFKPLNPAMAGRCRQVHRLGQFRIRDTTLALQNPQNTPIRVIQRHCATFLPTYAYFFEESSQDGLSAAKDPYEIARKEAHPLDRQSRRRQS